MLRRRRSRYTDASPEWSAAGCVQSWQERFAESPDVLIGERRRRTVVPVLDFAIGGDDFITMAGPCSVETELQLMATANHVRRAGARVLRGGAFKPRSSPYAFQGLGLEALKLLAAAREETGLAIVTEVMSECDVDLVADYADILQIGSRSMENYSLLEAAARSGRPILLKRGMVATIADLLRSAQVILENGNPNVILCERGIRTFETALRNTFDAAGIALLKQITHLPVIADPSHACGHRDLVPALARIGIAAGADGLLVEVHPESRQGIERRRPVAGLRGIRRHDGRARTVDCSARSRGARRCIWSARPRRILSPGGSGMKLLPRAMSMAALIAILLPKCGSSPGMATMPSVDIIVTAAPVYQPLAALRGEERFPKGAQLLLIHHGKAEPLVKDFAATADANVSFDGKAVLFAGKQAAGDPWQIWELTLADRFGAKAHRRRGRCDSTALFTIGRSLFMHCARRRAFNWRERARLLSRHSHPSRRMRHRHCFRFPIFRRVRFLRIFWPTAAFCLKPTFLLVPDRHRSCTWFIRMARGLSRTVAIMGMRGGAAGN